METAAKNPHANSTTDCVLIVRSFRIINPKKQNHFATKSFRKYNHEPVPLGAGRHYIFPPGRKNIPFLLCKNMKRKFQNFIRLKACKNSAQGIALGPTARINTGRQSVG